MLVTVKKIRGKYRLVERNTSVLVRDSNGNPVDGTGHLSEAEAEDQATAINLSQRKRTK